MFIRRMQNLGFYKRLLGPVSDHLVITSNEPSNLVFYWRDLLDCGPTDSNSLVLYEDIFKNNFLFMLTLVSDRNQEFNLQSQNESCFVQINND